MWSLTKIHFFLLLNFVNLIFDLISHQSIWFLFWIIEKIKTSHTKKPPIGTEISKQNAAQTSKQQKIRNIQQAIANSQSNINSNQNIDNQCLSLVFKIAHELLESVKEPRQPPADSASPPDAAYQQEFCSPSAELYLKENDKQLEVDDDLHETPRDLEEKKLQFNFLNGSNSVNYKKMLQYLSNTIGFKVIYQSLLGVIKISKIWTLEFFF